MEQWVSDTFYSYFPGFSNEFQKRQLYLQKRQHENQTNLLKHQFSNAGQGSNTKFGKYENEFDKSNVIPASSARSNNSSMTSDDTVTFHDGTKTDIEIIDVKNPNYIPSNYAVNSARPGSTRYKLLQDLRHTDLSNGVSGNVNLNQKQAEVESERKREYQRELMQQIEEKRLSIKLLKEKEHQQEEVLTRRLQEQLKTMKLEEKLEKERLKATKIRFDAEQNRCVREHILMKLENDSKLLPSEQTAHIDEQINKENVSIRNENKVYKYFSNSGKNEYSCRNKPFIPANIEITMDQDDFRKIEMECFHLSEKICPKCDGPLKELDDFCLRCHNKISVPMKMLPMEKAYEKRKSVASLKDETKVNQAHTDGGEENYYLVCITCERFYTLCYKCLNKSDVCRACRSKRNVCMHCRIALCSFCLEEVACGKNAENVHVNESDCFTTTKKDIIIGEVEIVDDNMSSRRNGSTSKATNLSVNNLNNYDKKLPYTQIQHDSIYNPNQNVSNIFNGKKYSNLEVQNILQDSTKYLKRDVIDDINESEKNIELLRRQTDTQLSRYLKNYSDLAVQSRGTQTTPNTNGRRDVVFKGSNFSIPLLREMPKMTRKETETLKKNYSNELVNLRHRWDIPAVQKLTVSATSPKVLTQVGAIRKQLQTESFFSDGD